VSETSVGLVRQQVASPHPSRKRGKYIARRTEGINRGGIPGRTSAGFFFFGKDTRDDHDGEKGRGEGSTRRTLSFTHFFLAQLAHGDRSLSRSLCFPSGTGSVLLRASSSPSRLRVHAKGGTYSTRARATTLVAEIRQCQRFGQSLHICLRLDVNAVVSRRVTASRFAASVGLFKTAEQPTRRHALSTSLRPSLLFVHPHSSSTPPSIAALALSFILTPSYRWRNLSPLRRSIIQDKDRII